MFILSNLIVAVAKVSDIILSLFFWAIIVRALLSWVNPDPYNMIVQALYRITEPVLAPLRRLLPIGSLGIDVSPFLACLVIIFVQTFAIKSLYQIASALQ